MTLWLAHQVAGRSEADGMDKPFPLLHMRKHNVAHWRASDHDPRTSVTSQPAAASDRLALTDVGRRLRAIFIGSIGNLVEWYDFYAYAAFALYFANAFFPGNDPVVQQLNAAILFAIGFIMRPVGGLVFGYLADHHG